MNSETERAQTLNTFGVYRPTVVERVLAAVAHLLALASLPGIVVTSVIWLMAHEGTPYLRAQAREALRWQVVTTLTVAALIAAAALIILGAGIGGGGDRAGGALDVAFAMGGVIAAIFALSSIIFGLPAVIGALVALFGGHFQYPIVGRKRAPAAAPRAR